MTHRLLLAAALLTASLLAASPAAAHDFWLEPQSWNPVPGDRVAIGVRVGEGFLGESLARSGRHIERFIVIDAEGERPVDGLAGQAPAGSLEVRAAGLHIVGYDSHRTTIELEATKFESYLAEEGMERIVAQRAERGESRLPGREAFSRCAKALFVAGGGTHEGFDRPLGLELELVPLADPFAAGPGRPLRLRLLLRGAPLAGARVTAISRAAPGESVSGRTDEAGGVELPIDRPGEWLIKAVHMDEAPSGVEADWESWWASLTFSRSVD